MPSIAPNTGWGFSETIDGELAPAFAFEVTHAGVDFGRGVLGWKARALDGKYQGRILRLTPRFTHWNGSVALTVYPEKEDDKPLYSGLADTSGLDCDWLPQKFTRER